jgi:hypothetical protein
MRNKNFLVSEILVLAIILAFSACQKSEDKDSSPSSQEILYSTIREVDFKNFTYPVETGKDTFTLKNGETPFGDGKDILFALENIEFADVTSDGEDEAIIKMLSEYGKTSTGFIYVYTLENQKPKILWSAATGFNAQGGLKRLYSDKGDLMVELFGKNQFTESKNKFEFLGETDAPKDLNRPMKFTKFRFKWNGEKFIPEGEPELLEDDSDNKIKEIFPGKSNV